MEFENIIPDMIILAFVAGTIRLIIYGVKMWRKYKKIESHKRTRKLSNQQIEMIGRKR